MFKNKFGNLMTGVCVFFALMAIAAVTTYTGNFIGNFSGNGSALTNAAGNSIPALASQLEVNTGIVGTKYVSPATLQQSLSFPGFNNGGNNASNLLQFQASQSIGTNTVFQNNWGISSNNPAWQVSSVGVTNNGYLYDTDPSGGISYAQYPIQFGFSPRNFNIISSMLIPNNNSAGSDIAVIGWATNTAGTAMTDQTHVRGIGVMTFNGAGVQIYRFAGNSGVTFPSWGSNRFATNLPMQVNLMGDSSNFSGSWIWPNHAHEIRFTYAWSQDSAISSLTLSNFLFYQSNGSNVVWGPIGGRILGTQTVSNAPCTNDQVYTTVDSHVGPGQSQGDGIRVVIPANYSETNPPILLLALHGNHGTLNNCTYDGVIGDEPLNGESIPAYFNNLSLSNNCIIAEYQGDFTSPGVKDSWGTTNSLTCADNLVSFIRQRWAFSGIVLFLESAGGVTGRNYIESQHEPVIGVIYHHAINSVSNTYAFGINTSDVNNAYGGSTLAQVASKYDSSVGWSGDCSGFPVSSFRGIPVLAISSYGDTTVIKTNQTDVLIRSLGGVVAQQNSGTSVSIIPKSAITGAGVWDVGVNGTGNQHGWQTYNSDAQNYTIQFVNYCRNFALQTAPFVGPININYNITSAQTNTANWVSSTNGLASQSTNTIVFSAVSSCTNTLGRDGMASLSAGTSVSLQDRNGNTIDTIGTVATLHIIIPMRDKERLSGTAISCVIH